jgi:hypothetical protein
MEFVFGLVVIILGASLTGLGIKMFIQSDGWFYIFKASIVVIVGLVIFGASFDVLGW